MLHAIKYLKESVIKTLLESHSRFEKNYTDQPAKHDPHSNEQLFKLCLNQAFYLFIGKNMFKKVGT